MKIGIIGAMDEELAFLLEKLEAAKEQVVAGCKVFTGILAGHEAILLKCGVGKVNAALGAALMCQLWQPDYIINSGCAGGFADDLQVGDIVVGAELRYADIDLTVFGYEFGQASKMPAFYPADQNLVGATLTVANDITVKPGLIVTSDSFIHTKEQIDFIRTKFPQVAAVEMEACAIAQVCHRFHVPFLVLRAISDIIHVEESVVTHEKTLSSVSDKAADVVLRILQAI
ncbi:MAG: 5'-methylthioadenosine/S-adenosylhomocysteine nucleosidase [Gammaproteobacteria bacterium]|nr:5'-methylthioadenosine/S-adenosylhomocysteine nucleosidase [Gammaproteobacteria bacterium]